MSRSYTFEAELAQQAEILYRYIDKPGIYTGEFTAAWYEQSQSGAECIKFKFVADDGRQANNLAIYTHKGSGEKLAGYRLIQKIMACMRIKGLHSREGTVELFDYHSKQRVEKPRDIYPGLYGPIGLVLTTEEYQGKWDIKKQLIIYAAFDPHTKLMADEIIKGIQPPRALNELSDYLTEKNEWHKPLNGKHAAPPAQEQPKAQNQTENEFESDDIPF